MLLPRSTRVYSATFILYSFFSFLLLASLTAAQGSGSAPTCPESDQSRYTDASGTEYEIRCSTDFQGENVGNAGASSLDDCIQQCSARADCDAIAHVPSSSICYFKRNVTGSRVDSGVNGARKASTIPVENVTCPRDDNSIFTTTAGRSYDIECSVDRQGTDISPLTFVATFELCLAECDKVAQCVNVAYVPSNDGACYRKSTVGNPTTNPNVYGAL